jgi:hypothetical protein
MRMWLKVPTKFENVPRSQLIAHSLSTLKPHNDLYEAFVKQLDRLVDEGSMSDDVRVRARLAALITPVLMMETKGQVSALDEGKTSRIVAEILARQGREHTDSVNRARTEERARAEATLNAALKASQAQHDHEVARLSDQMEQEAARRAELEQVVAQLSGRENQTLVARNRLAHKIASIAAKSMKFAALCIILALVVFTILDIFPDASPIKYLTDRIGGVFSHAALGLLALFLAILAFRGISYIDLANHVEGWVESRILRISKTLLSLD